MKTTLTLIGIVISFIVNSLENKAVNFTDVHNRSQIQKHIWLMLIQLHA